MKKAAFGMFSRMALRILFFVALATGIASAEYGRIADSAIDVSTLKIDESKYLGKKLNGEIALVDQDGIRFNLKDMFGKPLILILSYYACDGVCSTVNADLRDVLAKAGNVEIGKDFNVLTISFDKNDTAGAITHFRSDLSLPPNQARAWKHALALNSKDVADLAAGIGFKYFWSPSDRMFFHPNVYIFISPSGRAARYLYASSVGALDLEVALTETAGDKLSPSQIGNLLVSYCYSYNYKVGKYTLNLPLFIGLGSLTIGGISFLVAAYVHKRKRTN
ncbi:MAG: SCO family protein [Nitrospinae bacterium]|nr:SCO family protein [Nitrospinota bacterium]